MYFKEAWSKVGAETTSLRKLHLIKTIYSSSFLHPSHTNRTVFDHQVCLHHFISRMDAKVNAFDLVISLKLSTWSQNHLE